MKKREPRALLVGVRARAAAEESSVGAPRYTKNGNSYRFSHSSGYLPKRKQKHESEQRHALSVYGSIIYSRQDMEAAQVNIRR